MGKFDEKKESEKMMENLHFDIHIKTNGEEVEGHAEFHGTGFGKYIAFSAFLDALELDVDSKEFERIVEMCKTKKLIESIDYKSNGAFSELLGKLFN